MDLVTKCGTIGGIVGLPLFFSAVLVAGSAAESLGQLNPTVDIVQSNSNAVISWPVASLFFMPILEVADSVHSDAVWTRAGYPVRVDPDASRIIMTVPTTNLVQEFFRVRLNPNPGIFQFGIFYNGLLEFTWNVPSLAIDAPVHANGDIYVGSAFPQSFYDQVSTAGTISSPAWAGLTEDQYTGPVTFYTTPLTNALPISTGFPSNYNHMLIDIPPEDELPNSGLGVLRMYNQSEIVVLVDNVRTKVLIKNSGDAEGFTITATNASATFSTTLPFLVLTNTFFDYREQKTVRVTQVDIGRYANWLATNVVVDAILWGVPPLRLYVADNRSTSPSQMTAVRLANGIAPPAYAFTLATPNPLYVWGSYNCPNASFLNTTNTSESGLCALMCDALTILSSTWQDSNGSLSLGSRPATSVTVNAAIITGNVPSTGPSVGEYSGGMHNLIRLLENWSGDQFTLNTSLVNLYPSQIATNQFINPGVYFNAPIRRFSFDRRFSNPSTLPASTPIIHY